MRRSLVISKYNLRLGGEEQVQLCPAGDEEEDTCQQDGKLYFSIFDFVLFKRYSIFSIFEIQI